MDALLTSEFPARILNPDDGAHYFYGYYDLMPFSKDNRRHLCHRVQFIDRIPNADDVAQVGYLEEGVFHLLGETTAWNFQQGSMLQYGWENPDLLFYNVRKENGFGTLCKNLVTQEQIITERAATTIARDGTHGLGVNFPRIYSLQKGYGYCGVEDPNHNVPSPKDDGVWYIDFKTGKSHMLVDYASVQEQFPIEGRADEKFAIQHINLSPDGKRYLMLVRNTEGRPVPGHPNWGTSAYVGDMQGNLHCICSDVVFSHYWWMDNHNLVAYGAGNQEEIGIYEINADTGKYSPRMIPEVNYDIHTIYDPSGRYLIGDTYPRRCDNMRRSITLWDKKTGGSSRLVVLAETIIPDTTHIRCDLHNRWSRDGRTITFDSTHRGRRDIVELDVSALYED